MPLKTIAWLLSKKLTNASAGGGIGQQECTFISNGLQSDIATLGESLTISYKAQHILKV